MTTALATRWQPLGSGRQAPVGALRDARLSERIAAYKRDVAGAYRNLPPDDLGTVLLSGSCWISPKVDGMTAYLYRRDGVTVVLTPTGQVLADLPLTIEADQVLGEWAGLLAGERAATCAGRERERRGIARSTAESRNSHAPTGRRQPAHRRARRGEEAAGGTAGSREDQGRH